jgi:poly-gamma-glutamate capsule biosynthesis protein CapA/YwtB (metallophosphatase superfamily)
MTPDIPGAGRMAGGTPPAHEGAISLFLCGDVMTGRGIDQVLPHPSLPHLYESFVKDARDYVWLAEASTAARWRTTTCWTGATRG